MIMKIAWIYSVLLCLDRLHSVFDDHVVSSMQRESSSLRLRVAVNRLLRYLQPHRSSHWIAQIPWRRWPTVATYRTGIWRESIIPAAKRLKSCRWRSWVSIRMTQLNSRCDVLPICPFYSSYTNKRIRSMMFWKRIFGLVQRGSITLGLRSVNNNCWLAVD